MSNDFALLWLSLELVPCNTSVGHIRKYIIAHSFEVLHLGPVNGGVFGSLALVGPLLLASVRVTTLISKSLHEKMHTRAIYNFLSDIFVIRSSYKQSVVSENAVK